VSNSIAVLEKQFAPLAPKFDQVLQVPGVGISSQRLIRSVLISCERTPGLLDCTAQSLFNAAMSSACLGLECDGVTGQAFLIPFKNKGTPTAQLVIGYRGFTTLAARSGITISGEIVREGDAFDFDEGEGWVKHKKLLNGANRRTIGAWAKASSNDRPAVVKVLGIDDILAIKAKSPGAKRADSPWNEPMIGFPAMAEKSAKRRLARAMPLNVMQLASRLDEAFEEQGRVSYITPEKGVIVEAEAVEQPSAAELVSTTTDVAAPELADADYPLLATEQLAIYDTSLDVAARQGMAALEARWKLIPYEFQVSLKAALDRRHKHTAAEADRG
jgi:recombination protein RecT